MVCPRMGPVRLELKASGEVTVRNNRCATVTTDQLQVSNVQNSTTAIQIRYRILAVHRAAD
jgi:hypothetical protein